MKNPKLKVSEDKEWIEFIFPNGFTYDIQKERCKTERQLNEWVAHLSCKNWWSPELEKEFIGLYKKEYEKIV